MAISLGVYPIFRHTYLVLSNFPSLQLDPPHPDPRRPCIRHALGAGAMPLQSSHVFASWEAEWSCSIAMLIYQRVTLEDNAERQDGVFLMPCPSSPGFQLFHGFGAILLPTFGKMNIQKSQCWGEQQRWNRDTMWRYIAIVLRNILRSDRWWISMMITIGIFPIIKVLRKPPVLRSFFFYLWWPCTDWRSGEEYWRFTMAPMVGWFSAASVALVNFGRLGRLGPGHIGHTGKTTLAYQMSSYYASKHPDVMVGNPRLVRDWAKTMACVCEWRIEADLR